jgi:hypothetical protein
VLVAARGGWRVVSAVVALVGQTAAAAPTIEPIRRDVDDVPLAVSSAGTEGVDDPMARVAALINDGQVLFDTADFTGAIDRWTQAYAALPDDPDIVAARNLLTYQIAQAHIEAYAIDGQPSHLRKAERLLTRYIEGLEVGEVDVRNAAENLREDLRARIDAAGPPVVAAAPAPVPVPIAADRPRRASPWTIAGGVGLGLGGALLVGTGVAAVEGIRTDRDGERAAAGGASEAELDALLRRGTRANQAAIGTAVAGALLLTAGAALLITGRVRRSPVAAAPTVGIGFVGMSFAGRF